MPTFMTQPLTSLNASSGSRDSARKFWQGRSVFTRLRKSVLEVSKWGGKRAGSGMNGSTPAKEAP